MSDKKPKGKLVVVSGPSGVGKGTVLKEVLRAPEYVYSVSATTRPARKGEKDGKDYYFLTNREFTALREQGGLLEYAEYNGNYYGTPKEFVEKNIADGKNVILEIEVNGATQIKRDFPDAVFLFVIPDSAAELERRLRDRATEGEEIIQNRLNIAKREFASCSLYDYIIINRAGRQREAAADILAAVRAERLKPCGMYSKINDFFDRNSKNEKGDQIW